MSEADRAALARLVILAAIVVSVLILILNFSAMFCVARFVAKHARDAQPTPPKKTFQFSLKELFILTAITAVYATISRYFLGFGSVGSWVNLFLGSWCAAFIAAAWALYKTYHVERGVTAGPLIAYGGVASALVATFHGLWRPPPSQLIFYAVGGALGGMLLGLLFVGMAKWATRIRKDAPH
jgi:hypothetical protein